MRAGWHTACLGDVLAHRKQFITIDDTSSYRRPRVQLHAQGVVLRDEVPGALIKTKAQQVCRAGELLVAEIDAKVGGFGIVPEPLDGSIVSSHYFLFAVDDSQLDRRFLDYFVRTPTFRGQVEAQGSTNYAAIRPRDVLGYSIPLPPLPEQRRIVARVEELTTEINHAQSLRQESVQVASAVVRRTIGHVLDNAGWITEPMGNLLSESPRNGLSPKPVAERGGRPMLRINAVSSSPTRFVDLTAIKQVETSDQEAAPFVLRHDDVFIVRYNGDINRVAKPAVFKGDEECQIVFPDKLMRLRPDANRMLPDFLVFALSAPGVRRQIDELGKTTAGNIGISGADAKSFVIPVPPLRDQRRLVNRFDSLQAEMDTLQLLHTQSGNELDALMPAILDRAFKGEL